MIRRFSSTSKIFSKKSCKEGIQFSWQTSIDLSQFKYMAVIDLYISAWPTDGKKLCHVSSNLTETCQSNPEGHVYTWLKKPSNRVKGIFLSPRRIHIVVVISSMFKLYTLEFYLLDREFTDEVKFFAKNLKYSDDIEVEIIVEFSNEKTSLYA